MLDTTRLECQILKILPESNLDYEVKIQK